MGQTRLTSRKPSKVDSLEAAKRSLLSIVRLLLSSASTGAIFADGSPSDAYAFVVTGALQLCARAVERVLAGDRSLSSAAFIDSSELSELVELLKQFTDDLPDAIDATVIGALYSSRDLLA